MLHVFLQVSFQVADALEQPFGDGQFDLVWSMESGEHMPDKTKVRWFSLVPPHPLIIQPQLNIK